ncbi:MULTISPECIES: CBS domain-containing protein [unclassified Paracoccus (in: a-proteobacteria)]|uniref:CBS domain-containing protein n=1 Tax=unclassified Paracoccus (in: a-proteobacteria) TaxID=2688777 RepID=UPI0015FF87E6|nr:MULTISPECIES: CBS domain-containing protein [unclassified Paracoccus (in: a-proteobacteria)]MBB1491215.1 CBS domain-containing protein [Paracoccus sp. MC1854]MBB1496971.1 CBS domain-containing protein [Paracoccus sp. MC1862]QQO44615.1 CBS domain-containing protein [Paracoccus sp. MC1862]
MRVGEIMARHVDFIPADAPVSEAAELMGELEVGALPVGTAEDLLGVVTDRDILYRVVARGLSAAELPVGEIATRPVIGCGEEDSLRDAMNLMAAHHIRRLVVRDAGGKVIGWLTLADLARHLLVERGTVQAALRELTEGPGTEAAPAPAQG